MPVIHSDPDCATRADPWMSAMRRGDFAAAWQISDAVLRQRRRSGKSCAQWPRHLQFVWDGSSLENKRVLVRCYHGLGDTLQFVRLLAILRERTDAITLWVQPQLLELLHGVAGVDRLLALHDGEPDLEYDADIELMEIAHALRLAPGSIPGSVPYIYVSASPSRALRTDSFKVGICWNSGRWDPARSIPPQLLQTLTVLRDISWYTLQFGHDRRCGNPAMDGAVNLACRDMRRMAARMLALDLVISVDTMTAHLAGALGLPTWTLLNANCDWRWMTQSTSAWYPTMQLWRQPAGGTWHDVLGEMAATLRSLKATRPLRPHSSARYSVSRL